MKRDTKTLVFLATAFIVASVVIIVTSTLEIVGRSSQVLLGGLYIMGDSFFVIGTIPWIASNFHGKMENGILI